MSNGQNVYWLELIVNGREDLTDADHVNPKTGMKFSDYRAAAKERVVEAIRDHVTILQDGPTYVLGAQGIDNAAEAILSLFGYSKGGVL